MNLSKIIMEKTMNNNKIVSLIAIGAIVLVITIPTIINITNNHKSRLFNSIVLKITEAAKKCYLEEKCNDEKIFLKDLYDNNYIDKQINPKTKEYLNENSYVIKKGSNYQFIEVD